MKYLLLVPANLSQITVYSIFNFTQWDKIFIKNIQIMKEIKFWKEKNNINTYFYVFSLAHRLQKSNTMWEYSY